MRLVLGFLLTASLASSAQTECITVRFQPRHLVHRSANVVHAVAVSRDTMRITAVIIGDARNGDLIDTPSCGFDCPHPVVASEYVVFQYCMPHGTCGWNWFNASSAVGIETYLRERHLVTLKECIEKLDAWRHYQIDTPTLRHWIDTSDVDDDDLESDRISLTSEALDRIEYALLDRFEAAQSCDPRAARGVREQIATLLQNVLARFPKEEKQSEYFAWLEAHLPSVNRWESDALRPFGDRIEREPAWIRANECFLDRFSQRPH